MAEMCGDCGVFFEVPEFVVTDLSNYKIRQQRVYKKGDHFKEVLSQFQGKEGKHIPRETLEIIKHDLVEVETVTVEDVRKSLKKKTKQVCRTRVLHLPHGRRERAPIHKQ